MAERNFSLSNYPLSWPEDWKRTASYNRKRGRFKSYKQDATIANGLQRVIEELQKIGVKRDDLLVSTNVPTRLDGMPRSDQRRPDDPGVAVYWRKKQNDPMQCIAIDIYSDVADNLCAIAATLEAMRAIERHGGAQVQERVFKGFAALPAKAGASQWWEILQVSRGATLGQVEEQFRKLSRIAHPDAGGSDAAMAALNEARRLARIELTN